MDTIIKVFLGIYVLLMVVFVSMGIISANLDTRNAEEFATLCEETIKNSNYNEATINEMITYADENGYQLTCDTISGSNSRAKTGYMVLRYEFKLPIFNITQYHKIHKYI